MFKQFKCNVYKSFKINVVQQEFVDIYFYYKTSRRTKVRDNKRGQGVSEKGVFE